MAKKTITPKKPLPKKPVKQAVKETKEKPVNKKLNPTNREEYENGKPCKHEDCTNTMRRLPCRHCGRTRMRGNTIIEDRTGFVYLERLREVDIKLHNQLPIDEQEKATIHIFRPPKYLDK
jgi:hypothetical protein